MPEVTIVKSSGGNRHARRNRSMLWVAGGVGLLVLAAGAAWRFYPSLVPASPQSQSNVKVAEPHPPSAPAPIITKTSVESAPAAKLESPLAPPSPAAKAAYDEATSLLDQHKPVKAERRFDDALRADPNYIDAYVGRAQVRRALSQYELSLEDCNAVIRIKPSDPRGYNCRGYGYELLKQYDPALPDFNKAIGMNPSFAQAYADRGSAYIEMQQYDRAVQDYNQALRLRPMNAAFHLRRAAAYVALKEYAKAIQDDTEAIRLQPDDLKAYTARAAAEELSGDNAGAAADRRHLHQSRAQK
jgi:tetratricopeptide (TPR) repeat protein